jgi:hypothetical protein
MVTGERRGSREEWKVFTSAKTTLLLGSQWPPCLSPCVLTKFWITRKVVQSDDCYTCHRSAVRWRDKKEYSIQEQQKTETIHVTEEQWLKAVFNLMAQCERIQFTQHQLIRSVAVLSHQNIQKWDKKYLGRRNGCSTIWTAFHFHW